MLCIFGKMETRHKSERCIAGTHFARFSMSALVVAVAVGSIGACGKTAGDSTRGGVIGPDYDNGERQAELCRACHSFENGGINMIGPNLFGFFGRTVGTVANFEYSKAVLDADFVWTPRALDAWLAAPGQFLPGNRMTFAGVRDDGDRSDLIAYLLRVTEDDGS